MILITFVIIDNNNNNATVLSFYAFFGYVQYSDDEDIYNFFFKCNLEFYPSHVHVELIVHRMSSRTVIVANPDWSME